MSMNRWDRETQERQEYAQLAEQNPVHVISSGIPITAERTGKTFHVINFI
jgi:hypothetical protein